MFDHENGIAPIDQFLQDVDQFFDVVKMQPCRRLIEDIERIASRWPGEFFGEFDPLGFTSRKRRRGLAEFDIVEADYR